MENAPNAIARILGSSKSENIGNIGKFGANAGIAVKDFITK